MREYGRRQAHHRHLLEDRRAAVYEKLPRLKEIDDAIASQSVRAGRLLLDGNENAPALLRERIALLAGERSALLSKAGYPPAYLEPTFDCPDCRDTGYINGRKCRCFKKAEVELLYTQSRLADILEKENFSSFSLEYYSEDILDEKSGDSARKRARHALNVCRDFAEGFDDTFANLFFYGDTGVGKTFLSHCIAKELLDTAHSVIYFSAQELFEAFADSRFRRAGEEASGTDAIYGCDLLIIDDLGTELTNSFVSSELFLCLNERLTDRRSTIISTNLPLKAFADTYSERIFSRISSSYTMLKLFGQDIRLLKKTKK